MSEEREPKSLEKARDELHSVLRNVVGTHTEADMIIKKLEAFIDAKLAGSKA